MNIVQITPGAGAMYCGNCFRDNAMVKALLQQGHRALMVPVYLPLTLDEEDQSRGVPVFFNGVNVYLEQKSEWFRAAPDWLHRLTASKTLLNWAAGRAAKTRASDLGDLTLSMIRGEEGNQNRELSELIAFLKTQPKIDIVCLSNALLAGMARRIKSELCVPVACVLQGEDTFLDALPDSHRAETWKTLSARCAEIDLFIAPSRYFADRMRERLGLQQNRVRMIFDGINTEGYDAPLTEKKIEPPTLGYFARMCREKGLETLVEAFIILKKRGRVANLRLKIGGGCGPTDEPVVAAVRQKLTKEGCIGDAQFFPNVDRAGKIDFLRSLTVMSVPAMYGESFGLYLVEAWACGVPVVQPQHAAFPEMIEASGGGVLCEPGNAQSLAEALEPLLLDSALSRRLGEAGRKAVFERFTAQNMARETVRAFEEAVKK
jgi:glycosyltransferase involved in cell wall biosynthesis